MADQSPRVRLGVLGVVIVSLFATLFGRLWYLQVMAAPHYEAIAVRNKTKTVQLTPLRGRIFDRNGVLLAYDLPVTVLTVDRKAVTSKTKRATLFHRLAGVLGSTEADLEKRYVREREQSDPLLPISLAEVTSESTAVFLSERREDYPGIDVAERSVRTYPYGSLAAHLLGYVGKIPKVGKDAYLRASPPYLLSDTVGLSGVEKAYEAELRGTPGKRVYEIDAKGKLIRVVSEAAPVAGNDVQLTIDIKVQLLAEEALAQGLADARNRHPKATDPKAEAPPNFDAPAGAVVVEDPSNGQVIAMASNPTYDPRWFVEGFPDKQTQEQLIGASAPHNPLLNRAIQGAYSPASTFKLVTGMAAMSYGLRGPWELYLDKGYYQDPECATEKDRCIFRNAGGGKVGNGPVDLPKAVAVSSDAYFYELGANFWKGYKKGKGYPPDALQQVAKLFGFGHTTGIDLPFEQRGLVATPDDKKRLIENNPQLFKDDPNWRTGDSVNMAIGQGLLNATPLQIANAYSTFANGGTPYVPSIGLAVYRPGTLDSGSPQVVRRIAAKEAGQGPALPKRLREPMFLGLSQVVNDPKGTAYKVFQDLPKDVYAIAGKTGTAQDATKKSEKDDSLFVAFGPTRGADTVPAYTVMAILEDAGFGAEGAAPVVRRVFQGLLEPDTLVAPEKAGPADFTVIPTPPALPGASLVTGDAVADY